MSLRLFKAPLCKGSCRRKAAEGLKPKRLRRPPASHQIPSLAPLTTPSAPTPSQICASSWLLLWGSCRLQAAERVYTKGCEAPQRLIKFPSLALRLLFAPAPSRVYAKRKLAKRICAPRKSRRRAGACSRRLHPLRLCRVPFTRHNLRDVINAVPYKRFFASQPPFRTPSITSLRTFLAPPLGELPPSGG